MSPALSSMLGMLHVLAVDVTWPWATSCRAAAAAGREAEPVDDVVQPPLQDAQQLLAGVLRRARGQREVAAELALEHAVEALELLLLAEADAVLAAACRGGSRACRAAVLRRSMAHLGLSQRAALEVQLHALAAAQLANGIDVACHGSGRV